MAFLMCSLVEAMLSPGIMRQFTVTLALCGSTFAAGLPLLIVTPIVVCTIDAAGGICSIANLTSGSSTL